MTRIGAATAAAALLTLVACGGGETPSGEPAPAPAPAPAAAVIAPELAPVATQFGQQLQDIGGALTGLEVAGGNIAARWTSPTCDTTPQEVIAFLVALHQEHPALVEQDILAGITCGDTLRTFELSAEDFERYRMGTINDRDVLAGLS